jgi:NhaA family Na+:H+ antiporter
VARRKGSLTPILYLREFLRLEAASGVILVIAAALAIIMANSPFDHLYTALFNTPVAVQVGGLGIAKPLLLWINDGLMAVFFLLVGLEIKREVREGELSSRDQALLPCIAALGGMIVPAVIYAALNWGDDAALRGWAIPTATDIAFALGVLTLLGSRVPVSLKVFLTALAIIDDLGAIVIIALFYTANLSVESLALSGVALIVLFALNKMQVMRISAYVLVGVALWVFVLKSGVHATLAGVALAMAIPTRDPDDPERSPLREVEHRLHAWVAYGILPLFAFANAGVSLAGVSFAALLAPLPLGIALGLFFGKQIGVFGATWLAVKTGVGRMPEGTNWAQIYGAAILAGIGFTMSLFIGTLAFDGHEQAAQVRIGVLGGSTVSALIGYFFLRAVLGGNSRVKSAAKVTKQERS